MYSGEHFFWRPHIYCLCRFLFRFFFSYYVQQLNRRLVIAKKKLIKRDLGEKFYIFNIRETVDHLCHHQHLAISRNICARRRPPNNWHLTISKYQQEKKKFFNFRANTSQTSMWDDKETFQYFGKCIALR